MSEIRMTMKDGVVEIATDTNAYLVLRVEVVAEPRGEPYKTPVIFLRPGEKLRCSLVMPEPFEKENE
jgi:hypothetical protein